MSTLPHHAVGPAHACGRRAPQQQCPPEATHWPHWCAGFTGRPRNWRLNCRADRMGMGDGRHRCSPSRATREFRDPGERPWGSARSRTRTLRTCWTTRAVSLPAPYYCHGSRSGAARAAGRPPACPVPRQNSFTATELALRAGGHFAVVADQAVGSLSALDLGSQIDAPPGCGCRKLCHPMRPGRIRGLGRRAGQAAAPGYSRLALVVARARAWSGRCPGLLRPVAVVMPASVCSTARG